MGTVVDLHAERLSRIADPSERVEAKLDQLVKASFASFPRQELQRWEREQREQAGRLESKLDQLAKATETGFASVHRELQRRADEQEKQRQALETIADAQRVLEALAQDQERIAQERERAAQARHEELKQLLLESQQAAELESALRVEQQPRPFPWGKFIVGAGLVGGGGWLLYRYLKSPTPTIELVENITNVTRNVTRNVTEKYVTENITNETHVHPTTIKQTNKPVPGPRGERGQKGERGATGKRGLKGDRGRRGAGERGPRGYDGRDGRNGRDGRVTANNCVKPNSASRDYLD